MLWLCDMSPAINQSPKIKTYYLLEISALSDCFYLRFQEYSILKTILFNTKKRYHLKIYFLILLHFLPFQTIPSIFWKSPFLGPKKAHIMGIWAENHPFGFFSYKCLELSNSSRNGIKIQSWIVLNSIEYYRVLKIYKKRDWKWYWFQYWDL